MAVNARTEEFQHIELFDKYALFTNARIDRSTVPKGWYCYDFRGTDDDPGELRYIGEHVVVNHAGSVLMPEKLDIPYSGDLDAWDEFGFLDEADITLRQFCEMHKIPYLKGGKNAEWLRNRTHYFAIREGVVIPKKDAEDCGGIYRAGV